MSDSWLPLEQDEGFIVPLGAASSKPFEPRDQGMAEFHGSLRRTCGQTANQPQQAFMAQLRSKFVSGLGDSVRIKQKRVTWTEVNDSLSVCRPSYKAQRQSRHIFGIRGVILKPVPNPAPGVMS